ncbi:MAG: FliH/SctL family protein [Pseudomonadota bacterium]
MSDTQDQLGARQSYRIWELPDLVEPMVPEPVEAQVDETARNQIYEKARQDGYLAGFEAGYAEARTQVENESRARLEPIRELLAALDQQLGSVDADTVTEMARLAAVVAEQLVRTELALRPELIVEVVRDLIAHLPKGYPEVQVALHPEDATTLANWLRRQGEPEFRHCVLIEDEALARGDCRLTTSDSLIDAPLRSQIESIVGVSLTEALTP